MAEEIKRLKELEVISETTNIIKENRSIEETLHQICLILPKAWQYPEFTNARIRYGQMILCYSGFKETDWFQLQPFETIDRKTGLIEIYYTKEFPQEVEGPFLKEERHLISNIASLISGYFNRLKSIEILIKYPLMRLVILLIRCRSSLTNLPSNS